MSREWGANTGDTFCSRARAKVRGARTHHVEYVMLGVLTTLLTLGRVVVAHEAVVAEQHIIVVAPERPALLISVVVFAAAIAVFVASFCVGVKIRIAREQFEHRERCARKYYEAQREHDEQARRFELFELLLRVSLGGHIRKRIQSCGHVRVTAHDIRSFIHLLVLLLHGGFRLLRGSDLRCPGLEFVPVYRAVLVRVERLHELVRGDLTVPVQIHRVELRL